MQEHAMPIPRELRDSECVVLIISHDNGLVSSVQRFLERANSAFTTNVAWDIFEAGRFMATNPPDVVLVDFAVQGIDAVDLCKRLREISEGNAVRVVAVVAQELADRLRDLPPQSLSVLKRPFTPDDLRRVFAAAGVEIR